jgi:hypothetical protein
MDSKDFLASRVAEATHIQMIGFAAYLFSLGVKNPDGSLTIGSEAISKITDIFSREYKDLPEEWKEVRKTLAHQFIEMVYQAPSDIESLMELRVTEDQFLIFADAWTVFQGGDNPREAFSLDGINYFRLAVVKKQNANDKRRLMDKSRKS